MIVYFTQASWSFNKITRIRETASVYTTSYTPPVYVECVNWSKLVFLFFAVENTRLEGEP